MANYDFLNSPVIPGTTPRAAHMHRRSMITFIVLAVVIMIGAAVYYFSMNKTPVPIVIPHALVDERTQMINQALTTLKGAQPASQAEVNVALKQLSKSKPVKATQAQIDQALSQLKTQ